MSVFYAFCRVVDDVADSTELPIAEKRRQLGQWREEIRRAYLSEPRTPLGREMAQIIRTYLIAPALLEDVLNGVEMDLEIIALPRLRAAGEILLWRGQRGRAWSASTSSAAARRARAITPSRSAWRCSSPTSCAT